MPLIGSFILDFLESCNLSAHTTIHPSAEPLQETSSSSGCTFSQSFEILVVFQASTFLQNLAEIFGSGQLLASMKLETGGRYWLHSHTQQCTLKKKNLKQHKKLKLSSTHNTLHKSCNVYAKEVNMLSYILSDNMQK